MGTVGNVTHADYNESSPNIRYIHRDPDQERREKWLNRLCLAAGLGFVALLVIAATAAWVGLWVSR